MSTLYERIFICSTQLGITGNKLGELLGLKKSPLTDWKNGKSKPTLDQLEKMCDIFATSADYLLFGHEIRKSTETEKNSIIYLICYQTLTGRNCRNYEVKN